MRLLILLAGSLLAATASAATKSSGDRYADNIQKSQPFKLNDASYNKITKAPRDYSVAVLLTALEPQYGCTLCREFEKEWEILANSWTKSRKEDKRIIFGTLDFGNGKSTFQSLRLQTAPVLLLFNPSAGPNAKPDNYPLRFDFSSGFGPAEMVHGWLARNLPDTPTPPLVRPYDYVKAAVITTSVLGVLTGVTVAAPYILPLVQNRNLWAAVSLIMILLFTSGHMFNHIRKVPYVTGDGKGGVSYFAGGFQNQFGLETQIIAAIYGILSFAAISLALKVPRLADAKYQTTSAFLWSGVIFLMYSFLINVFKVKNGSYPLWLPPF